MTTITQLKSMFKNHARLTAIYQNTQLRPPTLYNFSQFITIQTFSKK